MISLSLASRTAAVTTLAVALSLSVPVAAHARPGTGSISGTLTSAGGVPMADVGVSVHTLGGPAAGSPARTGSDGRYTVPDLAPGTYQVQFWVERSTNSSWHQWAHQATRAAGAATFTVADGEGVVVDETRFRTGSLSLSFQDATGRPISAFCAEAVGDNFVETGCTETGALVLDGLPADEYVIMAEAVDAWAFDMTTTVADELNHFTVTAS